MVLNYYVDLRREGVLRPMGSIIHGEGGGLRRGHPMTLPETAKECRNPQHMVPKALIGLAVVTMKTDGWVFIFRL